ncbi:MAG: hypothetical protein RI922_187 [Bacteroidota bacterium]|jgi:glycosidase
MKLSQKFSILFIGFLTFSIDAQILDVSPAFPTVDDVVTITYNAAEGNGALVGTSTVYAHMGLITSASTSPTNWLFTHGTWGTADPTVQMTNLGNNLHQITVDMDVFYGFPVGTNVLKMAFVFRNAAGSVVGRSADGSDIYYDVYPTNSGLLAKIFAPESNQVVDLGDQINLVGKSNQNATLTFKDNGTAISTTSNSQLLNYNLNVTTPGEHLIEFIADNGTSQQIDSLIYLVNPSLNYINPPLNMKNGLNLINDSTVLLQLYAPEKQHVYVLGDFNNWQPSIDYHMNISSDSTTWWLEITNLNSTLTYGYQYFIDGVQKFADPLSMRIADPSNDGNINISTYPNPYSYPTGQTAGMISLFDTDTTNFNWQHDNFLRPDKSQLMVYELLIRDFIAKHNYQTLIDTLDYLDSLGINAIELMPVGEFEGNESWGYNPSFHMALDKYYGTPEQFKQFIDECHSRGIAVIMDIALNHAFGQNPMVNMYWDAVNNRPATNNPWFNAVCPHAPYCWGYDMNHEAQATKDYVKRINRYWLEEFHIDGYRFDFTKGFVNSSANFSNTRIDIIKNMADSLWAVNPDAYVILEHWADNNEEKILSNYGMLLWGNLTYEYHQAMKGLSSNFSPGVYLNRGWTEPNLLTYIESHDEERGMFECLSAGSTANPNHYIPYEPVALLRAQAAAVMMITTPGPKMIWQFGEVGYDVSIEVPCRICNKPILWGYYLNNNRRQLYDVYKATLNLRTTYPTFQTGTYTYSLTGTVKKNIYTHPSMNAVVVSNFSVFSSQAYPSFPNTGWWYEYFTGDSLEVTDVNMQIVMEPAEYRIYTTVKLNQPEILSTVGYDQLIAEDFELLLYPNPANEFINYEFSVDSETSTIRVIDAKGNIVSSTLLHSSNSNKFSGQLNTSKLAPGNYCLLIESNKGISSKNFVIN